MQLIGVGVAGYRTPCSPSPIPATQPPTHPATDTPPDWAPDQNAKGEWGLGIELYKREPVMAGGRYLQQHRLISVMANGDIQDLA